MNSRRSGSENSTAFDLLGEPVRRCIWRRGWRSLRSIQERAIRVLLRDDKDLIVAAPTAGGKTEAAFLPLLSAVLESPGERGFDLVYVGPLRALINDQFRRLEELCELVDLPIFPWHGDVAQGVKVRARKVARGVLLITPESLEALFVLRGSEIPALFSDTRAIVVDELHALLDTERGAHLRSLLNRLEIAVRRPIRRVGLSATLGDMELARRYLRPESPEEVVLLEEESGGGELRAQIRAYVQQRPPERGNSPEYEERNSAQRAVAAHLFLRLRGSRNLIFAGARQTVEWLADMLREMSERAKLPVEFFPHHSSLAREHRLGLERRLKEQSAITAVCTSTLELGIDIGDIASVAQLGAPYSVASLRQRVGRSGRRAGQPAVLRMYAIETEPGPDSHVLDHLHLGLVRSIAMLELLVEGWCEPPSSRALHLSTLTHQILSVIAERGGETADRLYWTLCERGPFRSVSSRMFARLLRHLGGQEVALIEQAPDGVLLLGSQGERLVEHYSFYAVFKTPEEFRILAAEKFLGTLPVSRLLTAGMTIIFSGRRWRIERIDDEDKVIEVMPDRTGRPPVFDGGSGVVHDRVVEKMREVLSRSDVPVYLDGCGARVLKSARVEAERLDIFRQPISRVGERSALIATWAGTVKTSSLALALRIMDYSVTAYDGFLLVSWTGGVKPVEAALEEIARTETAAIDQSLWEEANLDTEKYHRWLSRELLVEDAMSSRIDLGSLPALAGRLAPVRPGRY